MRSSLEKNHKKINNNQWDFFLLKFGLSLLFWKVVCFYAMTAENNFLIDKFICFYHSIFFII